MEAVRLDRPHRYEYHTTLANLILNDLPRQVVHASRCDRHYVLRSVINFRMTGGVKGVAVIFTPNGLSASATAFATAAGAPMVPPSAMPLNPPGIVGSGDSRCSMRTFGISSAVGT